jgi:hypothetical protein
VPIRSPELSVFIGYDPRQPVAFQVLAHSIWKHASVPVSLVRLDLRALPIKRRGLTEFTYSRFLVPFLAGFEGVSMFVDSDVLCRGDLAELVALTSDASPVWVVKNKLRFEWPSMMVFRNELCRALTPAFVDDDHNSLFDLAWAPSVGALPAAWNHCVGYDAPNPDAKLVHFTQGVPVWPETIDSEFAPEWMAAHRESNGTVSFKKLMGNSVHAKAVYERLGKNA